MKVTIDDDGMLTIPEEMLKHLDWKEGDLLEWIDRGNNEFELRKVKDDGTITDSE